MTATPVERPAAQGLHRVRRLPEADRLGEERAFANPPGDPPDDEPPASPCPPVDVGLRWRQFVRTSGSPGRHDPHRRRLPGRRDLRRADTRHRRAHEPHAEADGDRREQGRCRRAHRQRGGQGRRRRRHHAADDAGGHDVDLPALLRRPAALRPVQGFHAGGAPGQLPAGAGCQRAGAGEDAGRVRGAGQDESRTSTVSTPRPLRAACRTSSA